MRFKSKLLLSIFFFLRPPAVNELLSNWSGVGVDNCSQHPHHLLIVVFPLEIHTHSSHTLTQTGIIINTAPPPLPQLSLFPCPENNFKESSTTDTGSIDWNHQQT